ncbi:MAG TPA: hypothetical protein VEX68_11565 [Bryobacteraceae bacterium]|nr:hypothetical protein [Bryobacteraceae bacterium]
MMKQPAGNPNATPLDERRSAERLMRSRDPAQEFIEIEAEALRLSRLRDSDGKLNHDDWDRAAQIVRNRMTSLSKA